MVKLCSYSTFNHALYKLCKGKGQVNCSATLVSRVGDYARGSKELVAPMFKDYFNKPLHC